MDTTRPPKNADPDRWSAGAPDRGSPDRGTPDRGSPNYGMPDREAPASGPPGRWDQETESFGAWLCRHRRVRGIELREIAEDSKIGMTYLQAFEDDRFDILPAPVFAKGFLRQYANYVGLDPEEVVNFYLSAKGSREPGEEDFEPPAERQRMNPWKLAGLAIGMVLAVLILIWFLATGNGEPAPGEPSPAPETDAGAAAGSDELPAAAGTVDGDGPAVVTGEPLDSSPLRLTLDFSGECWVEVSIDGERRIAENKIQGESLVLRADHAIEVKIGDVGVVDAELNGRLFRFDDAPGTRVRNQRIDLDTVAALGDAVEGDS